MAGWNRDIFCGVSCAICRLGKLFSSVLEGGNITPINNEKQEVGKTSEACMGQDTLLCTFSIETQVC